MMDNVCPRCGKKLSIFYLKSRCPYCGADIMYYNMDKRLEEDAEKAEKEWARLEKFTDKFRRKNKNKKGKEQ